MAEPHITAWVLALALNTPYATNEPPSTPDPDSDSFSTAALTLTLLPHSVLTWGPEPGLGTMYEHMEAKEIKKL